MHIYKRFMSVHICAYLQEKYKEKTNITEKGIKEIIFFLPNSENIFFALINNDYSCFYSYERMNINSINNHTFNRKEINSEHIDNRVSISDHK